MLYLNLAFLKVSNFQCQDIFKFKKRVFQIFKDRGSKIENWSNQENLKDVFKVFYIFFLTRD